MKLVTTVHAYDVMDRVQVGATVRAYDEETREPSDIVFSCTTGFPGTGETDPTEWLRDALIGLLESL
jgi:hypothetical protein